AASASGTAGSQSTSLPIYLNRDPNQAVQLRVFTIDIGVAAVHEWALFARPHAAACRFGVAPVQAVDDGHSLDHSAERREALRVEARVVDETDENLRRARVRAGHGEGECAAGIGLLDGVVRERSPRPRRIGRRVPCDAELHDETGNDAREA